VAIGLRDLMRRNINFINQSRFVKEMNRQFSDVTEHGGFATAVVCSYFAPKRSLQFCSAGHPSPILYRRATRSWSVMHGLDSDIDGIADTPLGVVDYADYSQRQTTLEPGDLMLAFSDALIEAMDGKGRQIGAEGLLRILQTIQVDEPAATIPTLLDRLRSQHHDNLKQDDVTVALIQATMTRTTLKDNLLSPVRLLRSAKDRTQLD
jgi:serine phosphatase RsbU (regulator of sigma subunit)